MAAPCWQRGDARPNMIPVALAKAVAVGDIAGVDASGNLTLAADTTWDTNLATTQTAFALLFAGLSAQLKNANDVPLGNAGAFKGTIRVSQGVWKIDCKAGTYKIGTYVGPAKQSGNALENQIVDIVASAALAIGKVCGNPGVNPGWVEVEMLSGALPAAK